MAYDTDYSDFSTGAFDAGPLSLQDSFTSIGAGPDLGNTDFGYGVTGTEATTPYQFTPPFVPQSPGGAGSVGSLGLLGGLLGAAGPFASLLGTLAGGGQGARTTPQLTTAQRALQTYGQQSLGALNPFVAGTSPLQQSQGAILNPLSQYLQNLMSGGTGTQSLINTLSPLIQQAYAPFAQGLYGQAAEAGRRAGFYDSPQTAPPGGAILGPGLAQLQGQQAQSLLQALLSQIPQAAISGAGAFNQPINQQIGAAQTQATGYGNLLGPVGTRTAQPLGPQIGQGIAGIIGGGAQGIGSVLQQQQQAQFQNNLLDQLRQLNDRNRPQGGFSYTP